MSDSTGGQSPPPHLTPNADLLADCQRKLQIATEQVKHLQIALDTSRRIGAAIGILMCRYQVTDSEAFNMLRAVSEADQRKLRDVSEDVMYTGDLPTSSADMPHAHARKGPTSTVVGGRGGAAVHSDRGLRHRHD